MPLQIPDIYNFNLIFILSLIIISNLFILIKRNFIANFLGIFDYPNERKIHTMPTPLVGGVCLFSTLILSITFFFLENSLSIEKFFILISLYSFFFIVGLRDDVKAISPIKKTTIILIFSIILIQFENDFLINKLIFKSTSSEIELGNFSILFTVFCIFALFNAFNFIDGYNGSSISIAIFWALSLYYKNPNLIYSFLIISMIIIFIYNIKGKIFLGNSGTSVLSIFFSIAIINDYNTSQYVYADEILFLLLFPGIDMIRVTLERIINKKKIYSPDKTHFHHYLLKRNFKKIWQIIIILSVLPIFLFIILNNILVTIILFMIIYIIFLTLLRKL